MNYKLALAAFLTTTLSFAAIALAGAENPPGQDDSQSFATIRIDGQTIVPSFGTTAGSRFYANGDNGSQAAIFGYSQAGTDAKANYRFVADLAPNSTVELVMPKLPDATAKLALNLRSLGKAAVEIRILQGGGADDFVKLRPNESQTLVVDISQSGKESLVVAFKSGEFRSDVENCAVAVDHFQYETAPETRSLDLNPMRHAQSLEPIETSPNFRPALESAYIEWDWRMQDGVGSEREPQTYLQALEKLLTRFESLIDDLQKTVDDSSYDNLAPYDSKIPQAFETLQTKLDDYRRQHEQIEQRFENLQSQCLENPNAAVDSIAEALWRDAHELKRRALLDAPYFQLDKLLFVKHAPSVMSHQLTQVYGYCARPGGGLFILDQPGKSMTARDVTPKSLPLGSYMTPELSYDAKTLFFAFCDAPSTPKFWRDPDAISRRFHLFKASLDDLTNGEEPQQITDGDFDDFAPIQLPDGDLIFSSTRRGGFHRCGGGPCYVYTLARVGKDGVNPHPISFHETNEWFPTLLHNGRVLYTRWDYVDRDAVYYQQLWSTRQDGTDVRIAYGNNTFNPPGFWEPKAVPGSDKIMAIGGPHHGVSAGSVALIDLNKGVDGSEPIERLTPDVLYPEGEVGLPHAPDLPTLADFDYVPDWEWKAVRPADRAEETVESRRWPVHCFKSPYPLAEKYFIASYSYDKLLGEIGANIPNQFGIYFCDAFGNRELVYRDPNISSLWALPIRPRPVPPVVASVIDETRRDADKPTGTFFLQNVYDSWPTSIPEKIKALRVVQVLPKTTPNANDPTVGAANASPGKQVLGTVPVEEDGSAFFEAPAKTPLLFQALDEKGRMVQGMRSLVYLQPGETSGCVGCHEDRMASAATAKTIASTKQPSTIQPGPDGSKPFSYPILVQPVLDAKCASCHNNEKAEGNVNLVGDPDGRYSKSYNALISRVAYTYWGAPEGNYEPRTEPDRFGARASELVKLLENGHYDVQLTDEEWERLNTWIDANALFYGTFNPANQERQQRGERIEGPDLE